MARHPLPVGPLARLRDIRARAIDDAKTAGNIAQSPDDITLYHPLAKVIGLEQARAILAPQPTPNQVRWAERRAIITRRVAEGATQADIARELGVSPGRIWQLCKAMGL